MVFRDNIESVASAPGKLVIVPVPGTPRPHYKTLPHYKTESHYKTRGVGMTEDGKLVGKRHWMDNKALNRSLLSVKN